MKTIMKITEASKDTAKCPTSGNKYLVATGYCLTCKKKVGKKKEEVSFEVSEEVQIPGTNVILEAGDIIRFVPEEDPELSEEDIELDEYPDFPMEGKKRNKIEKKLSEDWKSLEAILSSQYINKMDPEDAAKEFASNLYQALVSIGKNTRVAFWSALRKVIV